MRARSDVIVTAATTVLRPLPFPASRARLAMPRSSMPSVFQVAGPGTADRSATPVISDSANGVETRQVRTMPAGVESGTAGWSAAEASREACRRGRRASGRTTKLANRAAPGPARTPTSPAPSGPRSRGMTCTALSPSTYSSARVPDTTSFTCIQRSYVHRAVASQAGPA